jgi:hypothetical protein
MRVHFDEPWTFPFFATPILPWTFSPVFISKANSWQPENLSPFGVICSSGNTRGSDPDRVGALFVG